MFINGCTVVAAVVMVVMPFIQQVYTIYIQLNKDTKVQALHVMALNGMAWHYMEHAVMALNIQVEDTAMYTRKGSIGKIPNVIFKHQTSIINYYSTVFVCRNQGGSCLCLAGGLLRGGVR